MKGHPNKEDIWLEFKKIFDCMNTSEDEMHDFLLQYISSSDNFLQFAPAVVSIIDYSTMQYLYLNDYAGSIMEDYRKGGVQFSISNNHPDDNEIVIKQIFPFIRNFLNKISPENYKDYRFSFNFRYKNKDGIYQHYIQHSTYIPDKAGNLRYNFNLGNHLPNSDKIKISLTIEKKEKGNYKQVPIETINVLSKTIFTKRETEVLKLLHEGLNSATIADKLFLSEHTVNNHRKNMLHKTGVVNTPALISYARENGIL